MGADCPTLQNLIEAALFLFHWVAGQGDELLNVFHERGLMAALKKVTAFGLETVEANGEGGLKIESLNSRS
jgi:hypothetical protein